MIFLAVDEMDVNSFNEEHSCHGNNIMIRDDSCNEPKPCKGSHNLISDESCNEEKVCGEHNLEVGDYQCNGDKTCRESEDKAVKEGYGSEGVSGNCNLISSGTKTRAPMKIAKVVRR